LERGYYKLDYSEFSRRSKWKEYVAHKATFDDEDDRTEEPISIMDTIAIQLFN
jgi:hypothetical protein